MALREAGVYFLTGGCHMTPQCIEWVELTEWLHNRSGAIYRLTLGDQIC